MSKSAVRQKRSRLAVRFPYEVAENYWVRFKTEASLIPEYEQEPLTRVGGDVIYQPDRDHDAEVLVGRVSGYVVRIGRVVNDGYSFYEACDAESSELEEIAAVVWDSERWSGSGDFREGLVETCGDLIVATNLTVLPAHRGKGIGLLALWRFLDFFGTGAALAVIKPFPLNHSGRDATDRHPEMGYAQFAGSTLEQGRDKLAAYYGRLGFERIPNSDLYYINMACQRPALEDLLSKSR